MVQQIAKIVGLKSQKSLPTEREARHQHLVARRCLEVHDRRRSSGVGGEDERRRSEN